MLENVLMKIETISLEEMADVKLMNRIDTKFLTTLPKLHRLLELSSGDFLVQEVNGMRIAPYYTKYFDTPDVKMYHDHQRGKKNRQKIRIREYVDSGVQPFLEIKDKNNKGRTKKKRVKMDVGNSIDLYSEFLSLHTLYPISDLEPKLENHFNRITLVNKEKSERITIDTSVEFHNFVTQRDLALPELVIIEWKRDKSSSKSRLKYLLRELRIQESGFSKYAVGMALTDRELHQNKMKPRLNFIKKLIG